MVRPAPTAPAGRGRRCSGETAPPGPAAPAAGPGSGGSAPRARASASRRPSAEPMQKWMPRPNASVRRALSRSGSNASGSGKTSASRPAAASQRKSFAPSGRSTPPSVTGRVVTRRHTGTDGVEAQDLVDGARDQRRLGDQPRPALRHLEQPPHAVADQVVRRLVPGEAEREQDRGDLLVRERLRVLVVDLQQRAREVVAAVVGLGRHELAQVAAVGDHLLRVVQRLVGRRAAPGEARAAPAPLLQPRPVGLGHAHEAEHDPHRQRERERLDQVERAASRRRRRAARRRSRGCAAPSRSRAAA